LAVSRLLWRQHSILRAWRRCLTGHFPRLQGDSHPRADLSAVPGRR
jgi:hypothetical protein